MLEKSKLIEKYRLHSEDNGSTEVQLIALQWDIKKLTEHLKANHKDVPAKRAMLKKIAERKRFFNYLSKKKLALSKELKDELVKK